MRPTHLHLEVADGDSGARVRDGPELRQVVVTQYLITPAGGLTAVTVDADGRMSPFPAGTTGPAAGHIRLVDWQTINMGTDITSVNQIELTVLYLKDAPGKYP
ncbi:unnamed protein product [marine sediment metagenome]|uniref:Uncharacterized protein n=1 Tax=marine sediment metagenome TaxID=412755 RepID=X0YZ47_9ZZZZ